MFIEHQNVVFRIYGRFETFPRTRAPKRTSGSPALKQISSDWAPSLTRHQVTQRQQQCSPSSQGLLQGISLLPPPYYAPFHPPQLLGKPYPQSLNPSTRNSRSIAGYVISAPFNLPRLFTAILLQNPDEPQKSPELQSYTINLNDCGPMVGTLPLSSLPLNLVHLLRPDS